MLVLQRPDLIDLSSEMQRESEAPGTGPQYSVTLMFPWEQHQQESQQNLTPATTPHHTSRKRGDQHQQDAALTFVSPNAHPLHDSPISICMAHCLGAKQLASEIIITQMSLSPPIRSFYWDNITSQEMHIPSTQLHGSLRSMQPYIVCFFPSTGFQHCMRMDPIPLQLYVFGRQREGRCQKNPAQYQETTSSPAKRHLCNGEQRAQILKVAQVEENPQEGKFTFCSHSIIHI